MYALDPATSAEPTPLPPELQIELDIPCSHCGYNLKGLKTGGRCPECRAWIISGVMRDKLVYASAPILRRLHLGAVLVQWACIGLIVATLACLVIVCVGSVFAAFRPPTIMFALLFVLVAGTPLFAGGLGFVGWFLLTTPEPGRNDDEHGERVRRLVRAAACVAAISWIAMHGPILASFTRLLPPSVYLPLASGLGIALPAAMCVLACACARRVETLADRLENTAAGMNTRLHDVLTFGVAALAIAFVFGTSTFSACLIIVGGLGMLIGGTVLLLVHLGMVRSLKSSLADAREGRVSSRRQSWLERPWDP